MAGSLSGQSYRRVTLHKWWIGSGFLALTSAAASAGGKIRGAAGLWRD